jgi:two-component system OmpR family response regulator
MSVTLLGAPDTSSPATGGPGRVDAAVDPVVTITVQITVSGNELPPAASRLISDLEALAGAESRVALGQPIPTQPSRALRLVEPAGITESESPRVRRIGRLDQSTPALYLHTGSRLLLRDGAPVPLTRREYDLFQFFCENPRRVFSRSQLLRQVWGYDMVGTERTVDVHVRRLRVKLGECAAIITTVRGVGYRLDDDAPVDIVVQED